MNSMLRESVVETLPQPYLLFLGDTTEPGYAKTAFGLRDWAGDRCVGEFACGATVSTGLPTLTPKQIHKIKPIVQMFINNSPSNCATKWQQSTCWNNPDSFAYQALMERIRHEIYGGPKLSDILKVGGSAAVGFVVGLAGVALCGETAGAGCLAAAGAVSGLAAQCVSDCKNATALGLSAVLGAVAGGVSGLKGDPAYANLESEVGVTEDPAAASDPASCPGNSFTGDTPVLMADGSSKPISQVKVGDEILATDPATGITGPEPVTALIRHSGRHDMVEVGLADGSTLHATAGHPVWDETTGRFSPASAVRVGDRVVTTGGRLLTVVRSTPYSQVLTAYNLHIEVIHTFYAGRTPVLVHNGCGGGETSAAATGRAMHKEFNDALILANKTNSLWEPGLTTGPNRPDGFYDSDPIELKPNTPSGISQGIRQLKRYIEAFDRQQGYLYTYDANGDMTLYQVVTP